VLANFAILNRLLGILRRALVDSIAANCDDRFSLLCYGRVHRQRRPNVLFFGDLLQDGANSRKLRRF
jgi:hypothetical protein